MSQITLLLHSNPLSCLLLFNADRGLSLEKDRHTVACWYIFSKWAVKMFPALRFSNFKYAAMLFLWLQCKTQGSGFPHWLKPNAMNLRHVPPPHTAVLWGCQYKQTLNSYWLQESEYHAESIKILKTDNTYSKVSPGICGLSRWAFMVVIC